LTNPHGGSGTLVEELRRTEEALREQRDLAETLLRAQSELGEGVLVIEDGRIVYANEAAGRLLARPPEVVIGLDSYLEVIAVDERTRVDERLRGASTSSEAILETVLLQGDGTRMPVELCAKPIGDGHGSRLVALVRDLSEKQASEQQRLELAREQAARAAVEAEKGRWELLARLSERLAASFDFESRLHEAARTLVPTLGDWCAVYLANDGDVRLAALEHADLATTRSIVDAARMAPASNIPGLLEVMRTGQPQLRQRGLPQDDGGLLAGLPPPRVRSYILAPLAARGRTFGILLLAQAESARRQDVREVAFIHEVARRVALSLDNARLHAESLEARGAAESALRERDATLSNLRKNLTLLQSIIEGTSDLVFVKDLEGRYVLVNSAFVRLLGRPLSEILGRDDAALLDGDKAALNAEHDRLVHETGEPHTFEEQVRAGGLDRVLLVTKAPYRDAQDRPIGVVGISRDITTLKQDERRLAMHAAQQQAAAELSRAALAGGSVPELVQRAVRIVADTIRADLTHVFEVGPAADTVTLRAGVGWEPEEIGRAATPSGASSQAGHTLATKAPVIVEDLAKETRFRPSDLLLKKGARSGVTVPIQGGPEAFGVLGVHSRERRTFTSQDVLFLQTVANVLATAIERKRIERTLRESEQRLRTVVMGAPIALFALDETGRFTLSEGTGLDHLGLLPEKVVGRKVAHSALKLPALVDQAQRALEGETVAGVLEADGRVYETRLVPVQSPEGHVSGVVGVATDVTERRRGEARKDIQYTVSRLLTEADSIEEAGPELLRVAASRLGWNAAILWLGTKHDEELSCVAAWQASPEAAGGLMEASRPRRIRRGDGVVGIVWSTGRHVWLRDATRERTFGRGAAAGRDNLHALVALPILSPRDVLGVVEFFSRDAREPDEDLLKLFSSVAAQIGLFVERRRALLEVRRLNAELESRVGQRTRELAAANRELEAFSYSVSHDLRAPLRTIDGFSKALLEDYKERLDDEGRHLLERVRAGTQRMAQLTDDLLKLSRITRADLQRSRVDLGSIVHETAAALQQQDPGRQVDLVVAPGHVVQGDAALLRVALENLVGNAWKFTKGQTQPRIEFGAEGREGETVYFVRDNGAGFDMSYANKLFVPFQRLHRASEFEGSGIGLATVHRIIQRHGGRVWAEGRVGSGATFYFTVPRS